jgi:hypothetical protein
MAPEEPELLPHDGEDEVGVVLRHVRQRVLGSFEVALATDLPRADGDERLAGVERGPERQLRVAGVEEGRQSTQLVLLDHVQPQAGDTPAMPTVASPNR